MDGEVMGTLDTQMFIFYGRQTLKYAAYMCLNLVQNKVDYIKAKLRD